MANLCTFNLYLTGQLKILTVTAVQSTSTFGSEKLERSRKIQKNK